MLVGIDPKVDYAFKHLFGRESTKPILTDLIEKVLGQPQGYHLEIELLNPFNPKEALDDKLSILDVKARDETGRQFNVEMQMLTYPYYEKRILYYAAKMHQQQLHQGQDYLELRPTLSISFLDHVMFREISDYHLRFRLLEESHHFALTDDLEFHILELPKFRRSVAELTNGLDVWLYFLRYAEKMDTEALPTALQQPLVERALEELKMLNQTDLERERYESRRKAQLDYNTGMKVARMEGEQAGIAKGEQIGIAKGEQIGIAKGEQVGIAKGERIGIIHFCERRLNLPLSPSEQLAGLSLDELNRLADELQKRAFGQP